MALITLTEAVRVDISLDSERIELDLAAGDVEVEQPVADLLIAQGLAVVATTKSTSKKNSTPVEETEPTSQE